ncbi:MAG: GSCFA domain-containing protein [Rikenellaceae bacterium]
MKLRTEITIAPLRELISYKDPIFTIGSCFAQRIGDQMRRAKLPTTVNPTGTLFNPFSICETIERLCRRELIEASQLREGPQGWYHYDFHSSLSAPTKEQTLRQINEAIIKGGERLREAKFVVITLGTAWIYELSDGGKVVANCHKEAARNFLRRIASVGEITDRLRGVIEGPLAGKQIILSLSPIRHISDGLAENSLSKATLRVAIEEVVAALGERVSYFPSYEIMVDDLRDYRFYEGDMLHPSSLAVEYIWERFSEVALSAESREILPRIQKIVRAAAHRPINPKSEAHQNHCRAQLSAIEAIERSCGVDMGEECRYFSEQLKINL